MLMVPLRRPPMSLLAFAVVAAMSGRLPAQPAMMELQAGEAVVNFDFQAEHLFDQWAFSDVGGRAGAHNRLLQLLKMRLEQIKRMCNLSDAQSQKLAIAGLGDIQRYFDRVDRVKYQYGNDVGNNDKMAEVLAAMRPLQVALKTTNFQQGSLFHKALSTTLTQEQLSLLESENERRSHARYHATVVMTVAGIDERVPLDEQQRQAIVTLLEEETPRLIMFNEYDQSILLLLMQRLHKPRLRELLDDAQFAALERMMFEAKSMEPFLKQNGWLPAEDGDKHKLIIPLP